MARGGPRLEGLEAHLKRLQRMAGPALDRAVGAALFSGGKDIASEAKRSITAGSVSGKKHTPSAPGEPPNNDTGNLKNQIVVTKTGPLTVQVSSEAAYAARLEFGDSSVAARPYMAPARDAKKQEVADKVTTAMNALNRRRT